MSEVAIRIEGISKRYRIGDVQKYKALRDTLTDALYAPFRAAVGVLKGGWLANAIQPSNSFIWALRDVSFEVKQGDVVGIIGRNGAGKSTLLKILSRITEPTQGYAEMHGRVGSLLEVGTGFHPELTGRENIYLNGAILGMKRAEINRKFGEIVAFAEMERFIDTPVKYYSSGMYVRLAFAVAAHLEPEILLVDEVLAVGDAAFQKKCLGKMSDVAKEGRTVLFVSHNMAAINHLCGRAISLNEGFIVASGNTSEVVQSYQQSTFSAGRLGKAGTVDRGVTDFKASDGRIEQIDIRTADGDLLSMLYTWQDVRFRIYYSSRREISRASIVLDFITLDGVRVLRLSSAPLSTFYVDIEPGIAFVDCVIFRLPLSAGTYRLGTGIALARSGEWLFYDEYFGTVDILPADVYCSGKAPDNTVTLIAVEHRWERS